MRTKLANYNNNNYEKYAILIWFRCRKRARERVKVRHDDEIINNFDPVVFALNVIYEMVVHLFITFSWHLLWQSAKNIDEKKNKQT